MTVAIPAVSLPGAGTGRDITGRPPASGLLLIMSGPAAPVPGPGSHPAPPRWSRDRSGLWLRNAAAGLCVLAAAAAAVSFTAQYRMAEAARHLQVVAALEAAIPDAAALVFACLGIALALHGRRALRARALNLASVAASVFMNAIAAAPGWRNLAIWALPPVAYALASDTLIAVVRTRHQQLTADAATPLAIIGGLILWLLRLTLAPASTLAGFRAWVLEQCPVAPGRRAAPSALPGRGGGTVPRKATKTDRFLSLVTERHGSLASIPLDRVAAISAALAPAADLNPGAARADSLTGEQITVWENGLPAAAGVSRRTARDARSLLHTILGDAASARPPLIPFNPAVRPRNRGRRTGRRLDRSPQRAWATPLEVLLAAERAALLSGRDDEFTMLVAIGYTGTRWGETIGLERDFVLPTLINVEWQLREIKGRFFRLPPKDDSYRSTNWEPLVPVDLPIFLAGLLTGQAAKHTQQRCACAREHGGTGRYMFYSPEGGHYRRSNFARRVFRPAWDGRYEPANGRPGNLVVVDATAWPGKPAAAWAPTLPGKPFAPPCGRGIAHLVSEDGTGHCSSCGRAVRLRLDGNSVTHKTKGEHCPGSGQQPDDDAPLACWLPVKDGLTPHGLRHSHKTWMAEDGIPEILAEQRLGHDVPGMRGLYAHVSPRMREDLIAALQARWENSLRERASIDPRSPVLLLDNLLAPFRAGQKKTISIPPRTRTAPILSVG